MSDTKNIFVKDIQRKKRRRMIVINTLAVLGALGLFGLLGFVNYQQRQEKCWKLDIQVADQDGHYFVDTTSIRNTVLSYDPHLMEKAISQIDIAGIYQKVSENTAIKDAHVYTTVDGKVVVSVVQRHPIARIFNADGSSFYLDKDGFTMPTSTHYTAKVPVFTGALNEKMSGTSVVEMQKDPKWAYDSQLDDIYVFTKTIQQNEFWSAMVEHVHIGADRKMEIIPRLGNSKLIVGNVENLELKLKKLMTFYASTLHTRDLNMYSAIDAEYDGQIVCVKRQ